MLESMFFGLKSISTFLFVWTIIALALAVIGGLVVYFVFLNEKLAKNYKGFVKWLYEFLSFKKFTVETILKVVYIIAAIYTTFVSFGYIGTSALVFFDTLIIENIKLRVMYELAMLFVNMCKNIKEINEKTK